MAATNYIDNRIVDATLGTTSYTASNVYVALYSVAPTSAGGGTELSGNGYSRQDTVFTIANNVAYNGANVTFTASGNWATVVAAGICDASTAGNILYFKTLGSTQTITSGQTLTFAPTKISVTVV